MPARRPLTLPDSPSVPLNRSEWVYAALDGPMGQLNQPYVLRFDAPFTAETAYKALRRMLSAFPRLRAVLEPTPRRYRLRILPDDDALDVLAQAAFRVEQVDLDDPQAVLRWHEYALNDPVPLQRGLGVRMHYVAHPTRPGLIWSVHHLLLDGRSIMLTLDALVQLLNGRPIEDLPVENPSMLPAVMPARWRELPGKLLAAWRAQKAQREELSRYEIVRLPNRGHARYLTVGVQHHDLGCTTAALSQAAKARGGSSNSMLVAGMGTAILEMSGNRPGTAALIRMSVDLRRYFPDGKGPQMGNYVAIVDLLLPQHVPEAERVTWIDAQVRLGLERFKQRTMVLPLLPYEWLGGLRTHDYTRLLLAARRGGGMPFLSCHATNIGSADAFNPPDATVRLEEVYPTVGGAAPLLVLVGIAGRQIMTASNLRDEYADADVRAMAERLKQVLARWMPAPAA